MITHKHPTDPTKEVVVSHTRVVRWRITGCPETERWFDNSNSSEAIALMVKLAGDGVNFETFIQAHETVRDKRCWRTDYD